MKHRVRSLVATLVVCALLAEPLTTTAAGASSVDPTTTTPTATADSPFDDNDNEMPPAVRLSFDGSRLAPLGRKMFVKFTVSNATSFPTALGSPLTVRFGSLPPGITLESVYPVAEEGQGGWTCTGVSCSTAVPVAPLGSVDGLATFDVAADAAVGSIEQSLLQQLLSSAQTNVDKDALQRALESMTSVTATMTSKVNGQSIVSDASYKITAVPQDTAVDAEMFAFVPPSTIEGRTTTWTLVAANSGAVAVQGVVVATSFATSGLTEAQASGANWTCTTESCSYDAALAAGSLSEPLSFSGVIPEASSAFNAPLVEWTPQVTFGAKSGSIDLSYLPTPEEPPNVVVTMVPAGGVPLTTVGADASLDIGLVTIGGRARDVSLAIESAGATFVSSSGVSCTANGAAAACEIPVIESGKPVKGVVRFRVKDDASEGLVISANAVAPGEPSDKTSDNATSATLVVRQKGEPIPVLFPAKRDGAGGWSLDAIAAQPLTPTRPDTVAYVVKNVGSEPIAAGTELKVSVVFPKVVTTRATDEWSCVENPAPDNSLRPSEAILSGAADAANAVGADAEVVGPNAWQQLDCSLTTAQDIAPDAQAPAIVFNISASNVARSVAGAIAARLVSAAGSATPATQSVERILVVDVPRIEVQSLVGDAPPVRRGTSSKATVKVENRGETAVTPILLAAADSAAGIDAVEGEGLECVRIGGSLAIGVALCRAEQSAPDDAGSEARVSIRPQGPATEGAWSYRVVPIAVGRAVVVGGTTAGLVRETAPLTIDASGPEMVSDVSFKSRTNTMEPTRVVLNVTHNGASVEWKQTAGPVSVTLAKDDEGNVSFTAPDVGASASLTFRATVRDGAASASDDVTVRVEPSATYRAPQPAAQSSSFSSEGAVRTLPFRADRPRFANAGLRPASASVYYRRAFVRSAPGAVDSPPVAPPEPWTAGSSAVRVRADSLGNGTVSAVPGATVTIVGASTAGVTWAWAVDSGDVGLVDAPGIVAAVAGATGPVLRFTAPAATGILQLRATVTASRVSATDIVTVKVGDSAAPTAVTFDVAGTTRPLIVVSGGRRDVVATSPAGSTVTWSLVPASADVTLTSTATGVRISGTSPSRPLTGFVSAVARDAAGRIVAVGGFPLVVAPATTFGSLCDVTTAASGLLRSIPGVSGLDLSAEVAAATATCATGTRLTFSGKSFTFAGLSAVDISGSLDSSGLKFTGGTLDFPSTWPIDDVELGEDSGSVISFRNISGVSLGRPTVRLRGALSASLATSLSAFGGWTWAPTISIENGNLRSIWLRGEGPTREDGTRSSLSARAVPAANGETTFEVAASGVEIISGLRADIAGTVGTGAASPLNLRGSIVGTWAPFTGALMSNMSMTFRTGQPTSISGTLALSTGGLAGLSVGVRVTFATSEQWSLVVDASQSRDLTVVEGVILRGATVSGTISRNAANITGSLEFGVPTIAINSFAEISNLRATAGFDCRTGAACDARFTLASSLVLRTATPTSINVTGSVDTATRTLRLTGSVNSLAITSGVTLSAVAFAYENRAGVVSMTATATTRVFDTDVSVNVAFAPNSTVVTGGINNLRLFGNAGPEVSAEIAFAVNPARDVTWNPTTPSLRALNLPAITLPADTIHLTASVTTPSAFRTFLGSAIPEKFVIRANYASRRFTLLGREAGGQVGGTVSQDASGWRWDATLGLNGDFEFFRGVAFRAPSIRVRGGGGVELKFGLSGNLAFNLTGSEFVVPFDLPALDSTDWTIDLRTPVGFNVEPIRGLRLETLGGSIRRVNSQVNVAVSFSQAARATWQPFVGFTVSDAAVSASATCASLENLESCETTFSMRGSIAVPSLAGAADFNAVKDALGWTITAQVGEIRLAPGVRLTAASASIVIPTSGSTTASAQGTFNILGVNLTANVRYSEQGVVLTAGIRGTWEPIPGGPSFSDASIAFSTYEVANFDPAGSPAPQQLRANDPTFFGAVNIPAGLRRALGLDGVRIEPVGLSLGNVSSGNFGFNVAISTGQRWLVNFGGKGLRLTEVGIRIAMRNYVPTFGLYGAAELVVPSQPSGVPLVLDLTVTATGGLSIAATLGIDANGRERPWTNAFGVSGLTVRALAASFSLQPPNPFPGFGAALSLELPASIRNLLGMSEGVVITAVLNLQVDSMCLSLTAVGRTPSDKVIDIVGGALSATRLEMTFAPLGCTVGRVVVTPGIRASFIGSILGVPLDIAANIDAARATFEASVSLGAFNLGPLRLDETTFEMATYGLRPLDSYTRFSGAMSIGSTRARVSVDVRSDGFDFSGSIDNLSLVPGLVEVKQARVAGGFDISDVRMNLNVLGSVEVLRQALNVSLDLDVDRNGVRTMRGSVEASLSLGELLSIEGSFGFDMSIGNPAIALRGRIRAAGFNLLEIEGSINRYALSVSARTDVFGIFQGSVTGKVVWCNADNSERILNVAGQRIIAQSGDFYFATDVNVNMSFAGFNASGRLKFGFSAPNGMFPQRQACGGNGQRAVGTPSTTTTTTSTTTTVPLVNRLLENNGGGFNPGVASTVPRTVPAAVVTTAAPRVPVSTVAITAPAATPRISTPAVVTTTAAPRTTTTAPRPTTTLAPSPPVPRRFFGEVSASLELGGSGFGGTARISGSFSTDGSFSLAGSVNLDLTVVEARAAITVTRASGFFRFSVETNVTLAGANVRLEGTFERSRGGTSFDLSGSANVNLYVASVTMAFRVNNNGFVARGSLRAGSRSWAYFSADATIAFTRDGWLVDVSGELVILSGLVEVGGRLAIGNLQCNARMQCTRVSSFAKLTATFPIGPFQFRVDASLLNGFSLEVSTVWGDSSGRLDLVNCWGRAKWELSVTLYIRANPARNQSQIELVGRAGVWGKLWGDWCWPGTPDNERDRWPYSVSASLSVRFNPWGVTVSVHLGVPNFSIGPIAGVRIRVT